MGKLYLFLTLFLCSSFSAFSQCGDVETHVVCDMTIVDGDGDGTFDGVINLYEEFSAITGTTITPADGMWFDPNFNFALDVMTGDLFLWDLDNSSENITDYQFEFLNGASGCPEDVQFLFNIVLGAYSGTVASTADGAINLQVCQSSPPSECLTTTSIDLFQTMLSNPSPHSNGEWMYLGDSDNFVGVTGNRFLNVNVPYQAGPPLVDEETFELQYRVPGVTPCDSEQITTVRISVVREPFAGFANQLNICEEELINGDFDTNINLLDDQFLVNENIEGVWLESTDTTGQISGPGDSSINLSEVYADLVSTNPRFGSETFEFQYSVESRSTICGDDISTIGFTFYEFVRPFSQNSDLAEFCSEDEMLSTVDLYDYIEFTTENGTLFDYPDNAFTNWTLVSGPSDLGLVSNTGDIATVGEDPDYTSQGTIDISNIDPLTDVGTYVFEFTVNEAYNATAIEEEIFESPDGCTSTTNTNHPCQEQTAQITIVIVNPNYAGENTSDLEFCETEGTLVLTDLLETDGTQIVFVGPEGEWTNVDTGDILANDFVITEITGGSRDYNLLYTTTTGGVCVDSATLSFTVFQQFDPGEAGALAVCPDDSVVDLFTLLGGTPDPNGTWSGPNGYTTDTNEALFDPSSDVEGDYIYTVPANETCPEDSATVTVAVGELNYAGEDTDGVELCEVSIENPLDLITLLSTNGIDTVFTGPQGIWTDTVTGVVIDNPFTVPTIDGDQDFNFTYTTTSDDGCIDAATLSFTVFESGDAGVGAVYDTCEDGEVVDLFTLLTGTPDVSGTWSGPDGYTTVDNNAPYDPSVNTEGDYIYTVPGNGACEEVTAIITVQFFATNYAGEDTTGVEVCETVTTVDLITLLDDNGVDTIYTGPLGVFTDASTGDVVMNPFVIPVINGQQAFDLIYTTTTANGCGDQSTLSFVIFEQDDAGANANLEICEDGAVLNLFDALGGTPDTTGTWSGPEGFSTSSSDATINPGTAVSGDYIYTIVANGACAEMTATVAVTIVPLSNAGDDVNTFLCAGNYTTSLFNLLSVDADINGEFIDLATSQTVSDGIIDVGVLGAGNFSYLYVVSSNVCGDDDATITFDITPVQSPSVSFDAPFICVNDGIALEDLVVSVEDFIWYDTPEGGAPLSLSTLLVDGTTYFVTAVDANGCESPRVAYLADVLPLSDGRCQIEISDGVSDNGDGQNDFLDLGSLPDVFPNFDIQIFNRYGTVVYRGNRNTPLFDGSSNTGSGLGDQLPTGVYFYIFYPNDSNSEPIDGSFYLSR